MCRFGGGCLLYDGSVTCGSAVRSLAPKAPGRVSAGPAWRRPGSPWTLRASSPFHGVVVMAPPLAASGFFSHSRTASVLR